MTATIDNLVRMANQIAANLQHEADVAQAVADHIRLFWDPRMRRLILSPEVSGLSPDAATAIARLRDTA
ncbi:MAG: formate dehydrogenase subunit delta [Alphaproteobacteria bacterium]|nr:formate dehydrogenase subunit delta [Alphaproteobacteria bacterium]